ncbi:MAG: hypothetical protein U0V49_00525 [Saprospiraceae bacterium]
MDVQEEDIQEFYDREVAQVDWGASQCYQVKKKSILNYPETFWDMSRIIKSISFFPFSTLDY